MKLNKAKKLIVGLVLAMTLLAGAGLTTAEAQSRRGYRPGRIFIYRNPFWYRHYDPFWSSYYAPTYRVVDPIAYEREKGYKKGRDEGKDDAKKDRPADPRGNKDYLKSNSITFREAFIQGYNDGYQEKMNDRRGD